VPLRLVGKDFFERFLRNIPRQQISFEALASLMRKTISLLKRKGSAKDPFSHLWLVVVILLLFATVFNVFSARKTSALLVKDNLQASLLNVDLLNILLDEDIKSSVNKTDLFVGLATTDAVKETPDTLFVQNNSLVAFTPPVMTTGQTLGAIIGEEEDFSSDRAEIVEYIVEDGDSLNSIAEKFDITLETLLWANELGRGAKIKPGQSLIILPISGVAHYVKKGDTLAAIAKTYKVETNDIIAFNELAEEEDIYIGDILVVPGGKMPSQSVAAKPIVPSNQIPVGSSYFICPVVGSCSLTQGLHWHNAVDFASKCNSPIYAAAGGQVQRVRYGWNGGAGNYIMILHPNGLVTFYGHLATSMVGPGEQVSQGQVIALTGGKPGMSGAGISTGCHLHFEVRGGTNPFAR